MPKWRTKPIPWTKAEDNMLQALVAEWSDSGDLNIQWSSIANRMPGRSGKQCRERWSYCLRPNIKKGVWSQEEDKLLERLQNQMGNKWSTIAALIPGRTDNDVKNRWHARKKSAERHQHLFSTSSRKPEGEQSRCHKDYNATETTKVASMTKSDASFARICSVDSNSPLQKPPACRYEKHASDATFVRSCSVDTSSTQKPLSDLSDHQVNLPHLYDTPFVRMCSANPNIPMQMSSTDQNANAVYANDIFSPSFFPRQLRMSTASTDSAVGVADTPFTPLMVLAAVSSCHSGPFITDVQLLNQQALENIDGDTRQLESNHEDKMEHGVSMTPLPYKSVEKRGESKEEPTIPRILLGI